MYIFFFSFRTDLDCTLDLGYCNEAGKYPEGPKDLLGSELLVIGNSAESPGRSGFHPSTDSADLELPR